ncbi:MAG: hypothetical protein Q4C54_01545 [Clostridia bacterium]|nr:hypothetical protein [Clostridia bacterium]
MTKRVKNAALIVLALLLLVCACIAVPSASIREDAVQRYMTETVDDLYDFL